MPSSCKHRTDFQIRVFYIGAENMLREACCDAGGSWYEGDLNKKKVQVAPYSMLSACFLAGTEKLQMRVYFQSMDNTIREFGYDGECLQLKPSA